MVAYSREKLKMAVAVSGRERRADAVKQFAICKILGTKTMCEIMLK